MLPRATLSEIREALQETYCRSVGVEFMHLQDPAEREWLLGLMEPSRNRTHWTAGVKIRILQKFLESHHFENILNKKFTGQTRFSLEGAEVLIPMLDFLCGHLSEHGCGEIILGMAHRGRLNVQVNILRKPAEEVFREFAASFDPECLVGAGDVKYHRGYLAGINTSGNRDLRIYLVSNPSHLESVDPVVEGVTRGRQEAVGVNGTQAVVPMLIHGDAAFAGQGIVAETLNMSQLEGYATGGTLHIVINNQIGYTTAPEHARSTRYATDIAKMLMAPIFHVQGEDPEAALHAARLAADYRRTFGKDVVIDLVCYRRHGHNEGDEPYFTQPLMYERIRNRKPVSEMYARRLWEEGVIDEGGTALMSQAAQDSIEAAFKRAQDVPGECFLVNNYEIWEDFKPDSSTEEAVAAPPEEQLKELARKLAQAPPDFAVYEKLHKLLERRLETVEAGEGIDWANAESLAFATLVTEGIPIRLSGQDAGRGTFSQRHSVLVDVRTGRTYAPLNHLLDTQAAFTVLDSPLSEAGVLGFEYGFSLVRPDCLTLWEAQFGDFSNNAQSMIDLYIAAGEAKWLRPSGLTLLLPHGWEGLGPEHSSSRVERFLQLCADDNLQVCNPTTPAQYFHLLRRQGKRRSRKPLVILTPKSLLRHPLAVSKLAELSTGGFEAVLEDVEASPDAVSRVILCSGKIYYELRQRWEQNKAGNIALIRLEQFYPFPKERLAAVAERYGRAADWLWVQEEPENMGRVCLPAAATGRNSGAGHSVCRPAGRAQSGHGIFGYLQKAAGGRSRRGHWPRGREITSKKYCGNSEEQP